MLPQCVMDFSGAPRRTAHRPQRASFLRKHPGGCSMAWIDTVP